MEYLIETIIKKIGLQDPAHAEKLKSNVLRMGNEILADSEFFFRKYEGYLLSENMSIDYAIDCYMRMYSDMLEERWKFRKTGVYSNTSFREVERKVYGNEQVMTYHMNGLVLGQFLWFDQYERFKFFRQHIKEFGGDTGRYIEIGGGHGLYTMEALKALPGNCQFDLVDVSPSSIHLAKGIIKDHRVNYLLKNVFDLDQTCSFDFFTMGEVLEHLEDPLWVLKKMETLINRNGKGYITVPVNSAMLDHIYLFKNPEEIRTMIDVAGFKVIKEKIVISEQLSSELAEKFKVPIMYAAFVECK